MAKYDDRKLTEYISGENESYTDDSLYNITSYGADIMLGQIVNMYDSGDIEKPELQRNFVWQKAKASRFIDSILLGLPVPSVFLARDNENRLLIVDGLQRITTVYDYMHDKFNGRKSFKLSNKDDINKEWRGKAFKELPEKYQRAIRSYPLHAIIFEQKSPADNSGMYLIFERINTGGMVLNSQEIRNSIYHGPFNDFLKKLNREDEWRELLGKTQPSPRMEDVELILRFFAFLNFSNRPEASKNQINLVKYLNIFMSENINASNEQQEDMKKIFVDVISYLRKYIGPTVFKAATLKDNDEISWAGKVNPVIFDAVCTATYIASNRHCLPETSLEERYKNLVLSKDFAKVTKQQTTRVENIKLREKIAAKFLYDIDI